MGVKIPTSYHVDLDVVAPVEISGIPNTYHINIDHLPKIELGVDPLTINPITLNPLDVSVKLKEIPSIRGHVPADFTVGVSVLGFQLFCVRLCGEAQVITEPYVPNPCERCDEKAPTPVPSYPPGTNVPAKARGLK
ncbi:MAG: hypothetical protein WBN92_16110 [Terriglobia bacterium]